MAPQQPNKKNRLCTSSPHLGFEERLVYEYNMLYQTKHCRARQQRFWHWFFMLSRRFENAKVLQLSSISEIILKFHKLVDLFANACRTRVECVREKRSAKRGASTKGNGGRGWWVFYTVQILFIATRRLELAKSAQRNHTWLFTSSYCTRAPAHNDVSTCIVSPLGIS